MITSTPPLTVFQSIAAIMSFFSGKYSSSHTRYNHASLNSCLISFSYDTVFHYVDSFWHDLVLFRISVSSLNDELAEHSGLFSSFITCFGLHVLFCSEIQGTLSASTATPCSLTLLISLTPLLFLLSHSKISGRSQSSSPYQLESVPLYHPPSIHRLAVEHVMRNRVPRESSLGHCVGLSLLSDLSPSLVHMLV